MEIGVISNDERLVKLLVLSHIGDAHTLSRLTVAQFGALEALDAVVVDTDARGDMSDVLRSVKERGCPTIFVDDRPDYGDPSSEALWAAKLGKELRRVGSEALVESRAGRPWVWVIVSSSSGPPEVTELLSHIGYQSDCCLVIVQHMDPHDDENLLNRIRTGANRHREVQMLDMPQKLNEGVYLVPTGHSAVTSGDVIAPLGSSTANVWDPCADDVITSLSENYPGNMGVCFLSGMGMDGVKATEEHLESIGSVLCIDPEVAVVPSIANAAIRRKIVDKRGTPSELAAEILRVSPRAVWPKYDWKNLGTGS